MSLTIMRKLVLIGLLLRSQLKKFQIDPPSKFAALRKTPMQKEKVGKMPAKQKKRDSKFILRFYYKSQKFLANIRTKTKICWLVWYNGIVLSQNQVL